MLNFSPLDELEILNLLEVGEYDFFVKKAEPDVSKKTGKNMIKLTLTVIDKVGKEHTVIDYLIDLLMYKIKHFCDAVGLENEYKSGALDAMMCEGRSGKVKIAIDDPGENSTYLPKNVVKDYVKRTAVKPEEKPFISDDIPF